MTAPAFRVSPYRFTDRPEPMRVFLEAIGLRPVVGRDAFTVMRARAGLIGIHPLASAESTDRSSTGFCLETDDARSAAEALEADGLASRWWDEAWGRQAAVEGPHGEITISEPMRDTYGYDATPAVEPGDIEVVEIVFTPDLDAWARFFARLGFTGDADPGWRELRAGEGSGAIGLHVADREPEPPGASALSFTTGEPLPSFAERMRARGYRVDDVPDAEAPHVEVVDPDGERIEVHHRSRRPPAE